MKRFAKPYADVLLEAASAPGQDSQLAAELLRAVEMFESSPELGRLVANPAVPPADKEKVVGELASQAGLSDLGRRAVLLLVRNNRFADARDVLDAYREMLDRKLGLAHAEVTSAIDLTADELARVESALERAVGRKIRMTVKTDPTLVAGLIAQVGSTVFDASLRGEIQRVRRTLGSAEASSASHH